MECQLVELFGWPLASLDETDIESLIPFVFHYPGWKGRNAGRSERRQVYADQADWL